MSVSQSSALATPRYLQEEGLSQECKDILSSLPREKGWAEPHLYKYQGFWYPAWQFQGVVECQNHFQANASDVFLVSSPKCGTTWLKALAFSTVNRSRFPLDAKHPLLTKNPHEIIPCLELHFSTEHQFFHLPVPSTSPSPRLISTHLPYVSLPGSAKDSECKIVYICRNPKDTFVSLWHFMNDLRESDHMSTNSLEQALDMFCRGVSLFGPFWDHVIEYWNESKKRPQKVLFLRYEDIKEEPRTYLVRLAEFLGCPFSPEEQKSSGMADEIIKLCSFENMSNLEANRNGKLSTGVELKAFFWKGEVGNWRNHLTDELNERLNQITEKKFHGSGLRI